MCPLWKLLALFGLALSCSAELTPEECEPLTHTLPAAELEKIYGHWVMVAAFADFEGGQGMIGQINTSHLTLALNPDNATIHMLENNKDTTGVCASRSSDATVVDPEGAALTLHVGEFVREHDGITSKHNISADVIFYKTCPDCLVRIYKANFFGEDARVLFFSRTEGKHLEADKLTTAQEHIKKVAECLKFLLDPHYFYDGVSEVCHKKAEEPEVVPPAPAEPEVVPPAPADA